MVLVWRPRTLILGLTINDERADEVRFADKVHFLFADLLKEGAVVEVHLHWTKQPLNGFLLFLLEQTWTSSRELIYEIVMAYVFNTFSKDGPDNFLTHEFVKCRIEVPFRPVLDWRGPELVILFVWVFDYGLEHVVVQVRSQKRNRQSRWNFDNKLYRPLKPHIIPINPLIDWIFFCPVMVILINHSRQEDCLVLEVPTANGEWENAKVE